jgi:DNA-binding transcriptional LysR family regulator
LVVNEDSIYKDKVITKKDLRTLPLILLPYRASNRKNFNKFCTANGIVVNPQMEIGNDLIIEECAGNGLGVGLVVKEYVESKLNNHELFELETAFEIEPKYLVCLIDKNRKNNTVINKFLELLQKDTN